MLLWAEVDVAVSMAEDVAVLHRGRRAQQLLRDGVDADASALQAAVREGEQAWVRLASALAPLLRRTAREELGRVPTASSRVDLDDVVQEGLVGVLKATERFRSGVARSDTTYLLLWARTEMRRFLERNGHDLFVERSISERARRVRAVRRRVSDLLGRPATDAEVVDGAADVQHRGGYGGARWIGTEQPALDPEEVLHERMYAARLGWLCRVDAPLGSDGRHREAPDPVPLPDEQVEQADASAAVAALVRAALAELVIDAWGWHVIVLCFGLLPGQPPRSQRQVAALLDLERRKVAAVVSAVTGELRRPGGPLHRQLLRLSATDVDVLGLRSIAAAFDESGCGGQHVPAGAGSWAALTPESELAWPYPAVRAAS